MDESKRLLNMLERRLDGREWIMSDYSIADIATVGWVHNLITSYEARDLVEFDRLIRVPAWLDRVLARPAVIAGYKSPEVRSAGLPHSEARHKHSADDHQRAAGKVEQAQALSEGHRSEDRGERNGSVTDRQDDNGIARLKSADLAELTEQRQRADRQQPEETVAVDRLPQVQDGYQKHEDRQNIDIGHDGNRSFATGQQLDEKQFGPRHQRTEHDKTQNEAGRSRGTLRRFSAGNEHGAGKTDHGGQPAHGTGAFFQKHHRQKHGNDTVGEADGGGVLISHEQRCGYDAQFAEDATGGARHTQA